MSNLPAAHSHPVNEPAPRPVSLITTLFVLALFATFLLVVRWLYEPAGTAPQNAAAENLGKDLEWRSTTASRRAALQDLRETQQKQASGYGWVDQQAGVVHLPIERAMELTVQQYGAKQ